MRRSILRHLAAAAALVGASVASALDLPPIAAPTSMFAAHRQRLVAKMAPGSVAVFKSAPVTNLPGNVDFEYRQNSDFWWVTGLPDPESVAVLRKTDSPGGVLTLFVRAKDARREGYDGSRPTPAEAAASTGADAAYVVDEVWTRLAAKDPQTGAWSGLLAGASSVLLSDGGDKEFAAKLKAAVAELKTGDAAPPVTEARDVVHELRLVKDEEEIKLLRRASELSGRAHIRAMREAAPGKWEFEVQAALDGYCLAQGARRMAYPSIAGSGPNALVLHYDKSTRQAREGDLLLNDSACEYQYYASDITRTYPVSGKFTPEQRAVYEVVLAAQKAAIAAVKPGVSRTEIETLATRALVEGLIRLGLLTGSVDDLSRRDADHRRFTRHGVCHWVGLDVHDPGRPVVDGKPRPLEPGMVFTIEPGLYIPQAGDVVSKYQGIAVRIEDVVLVTKEGVDCLTCFVPKELEDVEKAVAAGRARP